MQNWHTCGICWRLPARSSPRIDGIPFIRVADVTHGEGTIKSGNLIYISHEAHKEISRSKVVPGDVVIAKTGATIQTIRDQAKQLRTEAAVGLEQAKQEVEAMILR